MHGGTRLGGNHYGLAVVCNLKDIQAHSKFILESTVSLPRATVAPNPPCILCADSLRTLASLDFALIARRISKFLYLELRRRQRKHSAHPRFIYSPSAPDGAEKHRVINDRVLSVLDAGLPIFTPPVPQQPNYHDCGFCALMVGEEILRRKQVVTASDLASGTFKGFSDRMFDVSHIKVHTSD